jgi:hypothetical protein
MYTLRKSSSAKVSPEKKEKVAKEVTNGDKTKKNSSISSKSKKPSKSKSKAKEE